MVCSQALSCCEWLYDCEALASVPDPAVCLKMTIAKMPLLYVFISAGARLPCDGGASMDEDLSLLGGVYAVEVLGRLFHKTLEARKWVEDAKFLVADHKKVSIRIYCLLVGTANLGQHVEPLHW